MGLDNDEPVASQDEMATLRKIKFQRERFVFGYLAKNDCCKDAQQELARELIKVVSDLRDSDALITWDQLVSTLLAKCAELGVELDKQ